MVDGMEMIGAERKNGRVAIIYPWPNLDTVPSLCNAAQLLAQSGYPVDIFSSTSPDWKPPSFSDRKINLIMSRSTTALQSLATSYKRHPWLQKHQALFDLLRSCHRIVKGWINGVSLLVSLAQIWQRHRETPYRCFIGVDPEGLIRAYSFAKFFRVPIVYYSLELLLTNEITTTREKKLKKREVALSHKVEFVIIQDQERARLLAEDNHIPLEKFILIPNAPMGPARRKSFRYWHQRFGLPSHTRIVLHAGSLERWTGVEEIVKSVKSWPENWVLVVHTRYNVQLSPDIDIEQLSQLGIPGRVFFSRKPVPRQEYDLLVDGADIGIAFYVATAGSTYTMRNILTIGLASGKIGYYLRAGLPVIVNDKTSISELIRREKCGIAVEESLDIGNAIDQITQDYQEYSHRACRAFDRYFDFTRSFESVIKRIDSLNNRGEQVHD
jgi:glycosyltransferase involved in cell wall biosynthesis